jgi:predicted nucleic acid-binding protein
LLADRLARREARRAGLKFVGVAAVIGMAELQGRTPSARAVIDQLLQTDYRISQSVIDDVLRSLAADKARAVGN